MTAQADSGLALFSTTEKSGSLRPNLARTILAGLLATVGITLMMYLVAPLMMGGTMDIAGMLGGMLGGSWWTGMTMHFVNGVILFPLFYALFLYGRLPGRPGLKGSTWGVILWILSQTVVMPMMGNGFFSAKLGMLVAFGSLMGHLLYGFLLGAIAGTPGSRPFGFSLTNCQVTNTMRIIGTDAEASQNKPVSSVSEVECHFG